ncbi:Co/Zn/Cd efflux system membrane fusion protein [Myroides odoratimimus]|uniref:DUF3347 domain-containing protein n=1 Tax=Myroides odoratimimus CIP 101113 TaxID=883154 RepID=A0AAV3F1T4_9FLAO|nr:DUF3347 domain-containing protein [Myroides odoratimimus]EHO10479.1 hypothetical protein HMPREF9715_02198 [Myroides odoratimimus CIP 101113]MDM1328343.1 DUF3347 domain-containing protein [Myroides odoratimimus]MDM1457260.1 DUF3347 domain-containing protein [Myroides odoratimimus]MDM1680567.1 DUF3347 domain-containing protein [Myroides odoratimimus]MDX4975480.1 DUF3347 domain-containing protein [Myroides odoratimimus]
MKKVILSFAVLAFTLTACNDKKQETTAPTTEEHAGHDHDDHTTASAAEKVTTVKESAVLQSTLDAYFLVKKALQEDNQAEAATASKTLVTNLNAVVTEDAKAKELVKELVETATKIDVADIKVQREEFEDLTEDLVKLINTVGTDRVVFEQYCPMYNNGEGGQWLSDVEDLSNPLYGSSMLKCGANQNKITFETK